MTITTTIQAGTKRSSAQKHSPTASGNSSDPIVTIGSYLATKLEQIGLKHHFAVAGDYNLVLWNQLLLNENLRQVYCCNELNCGFAAEGYARAHGAAGFVGVQAGVQIGSPTVPFWTGLTNYRSLAGGGHSHKKSGFIRCSIKQSILSQRK